MIDSAVVKRLAAQLLFGRHYFAIADMRYEERYSANESQLLQFAQAIEKVVREDEREKCADLCDEHGLESGQMDCQGCGEELAAAIRARGE